MRRVSVRLVSSFAVFAALAIAVLPGEASAASVPYTDPSSNGFLGFCDASDHQITSGSILTQPFVVKTVASTSAPSHYGPPLGRAVLYVYQPIQYVDPSNWSGKQLTAATAYTNPKAPMAVGTKLDSSMVNFSSVFPLHLQGFAQVRMYFTASGQTLFSSSYPTANVKISGNTWTQVGGGKVNCKSGQAHSNEIALGAPTTFPTKAPSKSSGSTSSGASTSGTNSTAGTGSNSSTGAPANASANHSSSSGNGGLIALITVLVVALLGGGGYFFLRRRNAVTG